MRILQRIVTLERQPVTVQYLVVYIGLEGGNGMDHPPAAME
jgi:hypothetical protein